LRDLTQHLTTRADGSHAPPLYTFQTALFSFKKIRIMSNPGKVLRVASNYNRLRDHECAFFNPYATERTYIGTLCFLPVIGCVQPRTSQLPVAFLFLRRKSI